MERRNRVKFLFIGFVLGTAVVAYSTLTLADIIYLKTGREIEGKIIEETDKIIKVKIKQGMITLRHQDIESIYREEVPQEYFLSPEQLYEKKVRQIDQASAEAHYELGIFCMKNGLLEQAFKEFDFAQKIDPSHEPLVKSQLAQTEEYRAKKLYQTALSYYKNKNYFKALKYFNNLVSNYPNSQLVVEADRIARQIRRELTATNKKILSKSDKEIVAFVPTTHSTITEALEEINLLGGGIIKIDPGFYNEKKLFLGNNLRLEGSGADKTKLIIGKEGLKFKLLDEGRPGQVVIKDLHLQLEGKGIYLNHLKDITFQNCIVTGAGKGFIVEDSLNIQIINCTLVNLLEAIYIGDAPIEMTIRNSIISGSAFSGIHVSKVSKQKAMTSSITKAPITGAPIPSPPKEIMEMIQKKSQEPAEVQLNLFYNNVWENVYHNYLGLSPGKYDISKDPQFVGQGDYHLKPTSPCIDAGDPDPRYNNTDGSRADIGALPYLK